MKQDTLFLDHNATSPPVEGVRDAVREALGDGGNPSSIHASGRHARAIVEQTRQRLAQQIACKPQEIAFTSGGTEANVWAITQAQADRLIIGAAEHDSVRAPAFASDKPVTWLPVDGQGRIDLNALEQALNEGQGRALVSVQSANNETGTLQPIQDIATLCRAHDALYHRDATQSLGKQPLSFDSDLMTLSAHKIGGLAGTGALVIREGLAMPALIPGGGQELRRRGGTENLTGLAAFGAVLEGLPQRIDAMAALGDVLNAFEDQLLSHCPEAVIFSSEQPRLPNTSAFAIPGLPAETQMMHLDLMGVEVGSGSACSSGKITPSHVLAAMGVAEDVSRCALRVSFGPGQAMEAVDRFFEAWLPLYRRKAA